jgi:hypothetical protein
MGLYIDGLLIGGMATPDGEDPATFRTIERGTAEHTVRASYAVPADRGYRVGDITADGRHIQFGANGRPGGHPAHCAGQARRAPA